MHQYKFQVPKNTRLVRGQVTAYLYRKYDCIDIESADEIDPDRILVFSHPFDDWVLEAITKNKSINFFHIDNGYLGNTRHKKPFYYRISYNSLQNKIVNPVPHSRIDKLEIDDYLWQDWSPQGEYNLLVMPNESNIFKFLGQDYTTWRRDTIEYWDSRNEKLIIREKDGKRSQRFKEIIPLMKDAKKVITYNSMAAVEALCLGKEIKILGESAVEHWQGKTDFDRTEMLEHIAWSQYSRNEFGSGIAWECAFEYMVNNV